MALTASTTFGLVPTTSLPLSKFRMAPGMSPVYAMNSPLSALRFNSRQVIKRPPTSPCSRLLKRVLSLKSTELSSRPRLARPRLGQAVVSRRPAFDLPKSHGYPEAVVEPDRIRTSLDIPAALHQKLHEVAHRRGCSARQLILESIKRLVEEDMPFRGHRVQLPLVPSAGRGSIKAVTNDEALFT